MEPSNPSSAPDFLLSREYLLGLLAVDDGRWRELATVIADHPERPLLVQDLNRLADGDPRNQVRYKAKKILDHLVTTIATPLSDPPAGAARGTLIATLDRVEPDDRLRILRQFGTDHGPAGTDEILSWLDIEKEPRVLAGAIAQLAEIGTPALLDRIQPFLRHTNDRVVASAVEAMGHLDAQGAFHRVLPILLRDDNRVRANVLMVLHRTDKWAVLANLARMARHKDESYRASALWCLSRMKDEDIQDILLKMMQAEDSPELLEKQAKLLLEVGDAKTLPGLLALGRARPSRANLARRLMQQIATRLGMDLTRLDLPPAGRDTMPRLSLPSVGTPAIPPGSPPLARLGLVAAGVILSILTVYWMIPRGSEDAVEIPSHRPAITTAADPLPSGGPAEPSGKVRVRGQAIARKGSVLVLDREGTLYGCRRTDGRPWSRDRVGKEIMVEGRLHGWDRDHGFYRLDTAGGGEL